MHPIFVVRPTRLGSIFFELLRHGGMLLAALGFVSIGVQAQPAPLVAVKPAKILYFGGAKAARAEAVREKISLALERMGHRRGNDFFIEVMSTEGDNSKLRDVGERVLLAQPNLIYAGSWDTARQIKDLTATVPVVFSAWANLESPVFRIVENLQQPEGNLTGFTSYVNLIPKKLQLVKEAFPKTRTVGFVYGVDIREERRAEYSDAARKLGIQLNYRRVTKDDIPNLATKIDSFGDDTILTAYDDLLIYNREPIVAQLARVKTPLIHPEDATATGVLMHYLSVLDVEEKVAEYISKLLRGAKVRDLAVQEPQEFDFSVNMTTLRRNGLTMSRDVLARARKVE